MRFRSPWDALPAWIFLTALALPPAAQAQSPPVRLVYAHDPRLTDCPDDRAIRAGVTARLGRDPFDDRATSELRATIVRVHHGLNAEVRYRGNVRRLSTRRTRCETLGDVVALAVSLAIDPLSATRPRPVVAPPPPPDEPTQPSLSPTPTASAPTSPPPPPAPSLAPPAPPPASPTPATAPLAAPPPVVRPQPSSRRITDVYVGLGASFALGLVPAAAPSASVEGGLRIGRWFSLNAEVRYVFPAQTALATGTVHGDLLALTVAPCVHVAFASLCGVATGGLVQARGSDYPTNLTGNTALFGLGGRLVAESPRVGSFSVVGWAELVGLVGVPVLVVDPGHVWRPDPPAFSAGAGARFHFR